MKPKLWQGADPVGEARARFNEQLDTPYTTALGPGFAATKKGTFSEVTRTPPPKDEAVEPALFAAGYVNGQLRRKGTDVPGHPFFTTRVELRLYNLGNGYGVNPVNPVYWQQQTIYSYQRRDGTAGVDRIFQRLEGEQAFSFFKRSQLFSFQSGLETNWESMNVVAVTKYQVSVMGKLPDGRGQAVIFYSRQSDEVDDWGIPTNEIRYTHVNAEAMGGTSYILGKMDTVGVRNYLLGPSFTYGPGKVGVFVVELPLIVKEVPGGTILDEDGTDNRYKAYEDAQGKIYIYLSDDKGSSWGVYRFDKLDEIVITDSGPDSLMGFHYLDTHVDYYAAPAGGGSMQNIRLADFLTLASPMLVFTENVWVFFSHITEYRTYGGVFYSGRSMGFRTTNGGATWEHIESPLTGQNIEAGKLTFTFDPVVLRKNVAIMRCAAGITGVNRPVRFLRTLDAGATWTEFYPVGLPASTNERVGYFEVLEADDEAGTSKVAVVCYDNAELSYIMYVSEDDGDTWEKSKRVQYSETFSRVDFDKVANASSVDAGSFGTLDYRGTIEQPQPLDIAQPWLYDYEVPPPS